ncbi:hypothetical protein [Defluviimonas salinarum]|uniref:Uncharacterized protein n=1 Tax=Defluviimonas salinarum TaxID=2992147 RepID=A0ABT3J2G6_9RHOB|nr:hypothetical protein [Defluviimonas salinarum]MCW3781860.1 hypothetical protein [Defluviimonas salinarum]
MTQRTDTPADPFKKALLAVVGCLTLTGANVAHGAPCWGGSVTKLEPTPEQKTQIAQRFALVCRTRTPQTGQPIRLFTLPDRTAIYDPERAPTYVDLVVSEIVQSGPDQFLGGAVGTTNRCPALTRVETDADGKEVTLNHWYLLSADLYCELKQPGEE